MSAAQWPQNSPPDAGDYIPTRSTTPQNSGDDNHLYMHSPHSPTTPTPNSDSPLLPAFDGQPHQLPSRSLSNSFVSSPLKPRAPTGTAPASPFARSRPASRASHFNRVASEESQALASQFSTLGQRGSMLLYRLASEDEQGALLPPKHMARGSIASTSGDSIFSLSSDSKYPSGHNGPSRRLVPYVFDPTVDEKEQGPEEDDFLHEPESGKKDERGTLIGIRGVMNVGVLLLLIAGLLCLFIFYPVLSYFRNNARNLAIDGNIRINSTGQLPELLGFGMPQLIDNDTPASAKSRTGFDGQAYELVFSDEFNVDGRTFYPGDDPFWEAVDLWYWATNDQEWYDPGQITTSNGSLRILMENVETHGLPYRSGMLQSWNKFCFSSGYIEVSITLPGPDQNTQGYWPGAWTMGNLGRPGYGATTDGTWPYSYQACDVGTFPNQTYANASGPAAAIHSDASKEKYNYALSWLSGQKLSSCTCKDEDHPGPSVNIGRGAPEIDILEVERNKAGDGQVVSQSAQFAPFSTDYNSLNDTTDQWTVYNPAISRPNPYKGSAVQQAVSGLTQLPANMFQGSGQVFTTFGFEYWSDPSNPDDSFITWQTAGSPSVRVGAAAVGPDASTGVSQRLIPVEPMSIILNLGISTNWQTIDLSTMEFPAIMLVDYVRVYQRKGHTNVGCDPKGYPTANYINAHMDSYTNPNLTTWNYARPKNGLYSGGC